MYALLGILGGILIMVVAFILTNMSKDVTECPRCGSWARLEDIAKNGDLIFICPKCRRKIVMKNNKEADKNENTNAAT